MVALTINIYKGKRYIFIVGVKYILAQNKPDMDVLGNLELEKPAVLVVCANDEDFVDTCVDGKATDQKM